MAGKFVFADWAFDNQPAPTPPAPPEEIEANDAWVNDLKNQLIDAKQQALFTAPRAFLRQQGSDAITGAEGAGQFLDTLRQQTLDQTANNDQRTRLGEMLDWHVADAKQQIHRHVAEQSDAWQQNVAVHTVELATRQAALESGDAEKVGFVALAAYDAEKARALKGGLPAEAAHESGRSAWSGAYKAAIETQAGIGPQQAVKLFDQAKATLDPQTREALQPRIDSFSRDAQADVLADEATAPDADRVAILDNPAVRPEVRLLAEIKITTRETIVAAARQSQIDTLDNRLASGTPQALAKATYLPGTYAAIADGYAAAGDPARAAAARRLAVNEPLLASFATAAPVDQMRMLSTLEPGPVRDQALRIKDASDRMLANDALRWGTTTQRANGVGELVPLDLTPSPTNTPQAIAGALGRREQQARQIEALSGAPTLAMTKEEVATLKTNLDSAPVAGKQTTLRSLATDLGSNAIAHLAPALAGYGPLADGYALALSTYAAKTPGQNTLADRILDGLDRMKAAGEGGKPVANTGPDWRRAFNEKIASFLPHLGAKDTAALRIATAALYTQSMALKGKDGATLNGDELDNAIVAATGASVLPDRQSFIRTGATAADGQPLMLGDGVDIAQRREPTEGYGITPNATTLVDGLTDISTLGDTRNDESELEDNTQLAQGGGTSPRNTLPKPQVPTKAEEKARQAAEAQRQKLAEERKGELERLAAIKISPQPKDKQLIPADWEQRLSKEAVDALNASAKRYNVPRELLARILWQESGFDATSKHDRPLGQAKGIAGLEDGPRGVAVELQRIARIRGDQARIRELQGYDVMKVPQAIDMAGEYLRYLYEHEGRTWPGAVAAFNFGPSDFNDWISGKRDPTVKRDVHWRRAKEYLKYVFQGNSKAFDE